MKSKRVIVDGTTKKKGSLFKAKLYVSHAYPSQVVRNNSKETSVVQRYYFRVSKDLTPFQ